MPSSTNGEMRARLFDADRPDRRVPFDEALDLRLTDRQLLWIDVQGAVPDEVGKRLGANLDLQPRTRSAIAHPRGEPLVALHREYLHVRVAADPSDENPDDTGWLDVIAGPNTVLTRHDRPVGFLDDVDDRIQRDSTAGMLSSVAFFTTIMDGAITSYHAAVDAIEADVDRLDAVLLRGYARDELLRELVRLRRRIAHLRRLLADHRAVFTGLASPEVGGVLEDPDASSMLQALGARFDGAMGAVDDSRDALLGSFDIYMSRTAQRTNEIMKVLTIVTVLLLPGSVFAGLLGMNVEVPLAKDDPMSFWMVVVVLVTLAGLVLVLARLRRWI